MAWSMQRPGRARRLGTRAEEAGRVLQRRAHDLPVALDRVQLVVIEVQRGELPDGHRAPGHVHLRVEQRRETHFRLRVVQLHRVDRVHQRRVLEPPARPRHLGPGLGHGLRQVAFCGLVVGLRKREDAGVRDRVGRDGQQAAGAVDQRPAAVTLARQREVQPRHLHRPVARLHQQHLADAQAFLPLVRVPVDHGRELREPLGDLPHAVVPRHLARPRRPGGRIAIEARRAPPRSRCRAARARAGPAPAGRLPPASATQAPDLLRLFPLRHDGRRDADDGHLHACRPS